MQAYVVMSESNYFEGACHPVRVFVGEEANSQAQAFVTTLQAESQGGYSYSVEEVPVGQVSA